MFSYRHGFHAGNHADVIKHFVLVNILNYLNQKETPYMMVDTHAGAGWYELDSDYALKNAEFKNGIVPLWDKTDLPSALADYVDLVRSMNPSGKLRFYPGSPFIGEYVLREQDRLRLFELHPTEIKNLNNNFKARDAHLKEQGIHSNQRGKRTMIFAEDGFDNLKSLLPPPSRRALVLIDPPYEAKHDYSRVKQTLEDALKRFAGGVYAIWYPVLGRIEAKQLPDRLKNLPCKEWLNVTLTISHPTPDGFGLHSSGMFIINPPWTLHATLKECMPYLIEHLGVNGEGKFSLEIGQGAG